MPSLADQYVEVHPDVDKFGPELLADLEVTGADAGDILGEVLGTHTRDKVRESHEPIASAFDRIADDVGRRGGDRAGKGWMRSMLQNVGTGGGSFASAFLNVISLGFAGGNITSAFSSSPIAASIGSALAVSIAAVVAPLLGGSIGAAVAALGGLGIIGLGAFLLRDTPAVVDAGRALVGQLKETFKGAADPMIGPFMTALAMLRQLIIDIGPSFRQMFADAAPAIVPLTQGLADMVRNLMPGFVKLVAAATPILIKMAPVLADLGTSLSHFFTAIADVGPQASTALNDLLHVLGFLIVVLGGTIAELSIAYTAVRNFAIGVGHFFAALPAFFSNLWNTITSGIGRFVASIGNFFAGLGHNIASLFNTVVSAVSGFLSAVGGFFAALPGRIGGALQALPGMVRALFLRLFDFVFTTIGVGIGVIINLFITLPTRINLALARIVTIVSSIFNGAKQAAVLAASALITGVINFWNSLPARASALFNSAKAAISSAMNSAKSAATSAASSLVSGVIGFFTSLPGRAASLFHSLVSQVTSIMRGLGSAMFGIGADIIRGLINGISSMIGAAVAAAKRAVGDIIDGAKRAVGAHSPSTVARDEIGRWIPPGIAEGVTAAMPAAAASIAEQIRRLVTGTAGFKVGLANPVAVTGSGGGSGFTVELRVLAELLGQLIEAVDRVAPGVGREVNGMASGALMAGRAY